MATYESMPAGGLPDEVAALLVGFPGGTLGHAREAALVRLLNLLCRQHGYGYVPQIAAWIEDLWRHPEKVEEYRRWQADRIASAEELRRILAEEAREKQTDGGPR